MDCFPDHVGLGTFTIVLLFLDSINGFPFFMVEHHRDLDYCWHLCIMQLSDLEGVIRQGAIIHC